MSIDVEPAADDDLEWWDDRVERARHATPFHRREALSVLADHAGATTHHLVGYKGQEPVGLFPVFELSKGPVSGAFSPPPDLRVPYLGPALLNMAKLSQRKAERRLRRFVDGCFEWLRTEVNPWYLHARTGPGFADVRPFKWNDCTVTPSYTYLVDLTPDPEELLMRFSSDARSNVRAGREADADVAERGAGAIDPIVDQVRRRYESQDIAYRVPEGLVTDLYERLPEGDLRPYTCRVDGEFVGGLLLVEHEEVVYRWQGGVKTDAGPDLPVNDLLDWQVMRDAMARGATAYDLVGADNRRINSYKAKFAPDLAPFYAVEGGPKPMRLAASLYSRLPK
jgi:hypothetical protein